jgi:hypothetical protein
LADLGRRRGRGGPGGFCAFGAFCGRAVALGFPVGIAARDDIDLARPVEAQRERHRAVEEVAVVADDQHGAFIIGDHFLQQVERFEIEIVGRLVEHQQVRLARKFAREQQARALAARQRADRASTSRDRTGSP